MCYLTQKNPIDEDLPSMDKNEIESCCICGNIHSDFELNSLIGVGAKKVCSYCFTFGDSDEEIVDLFMQDQFNKLLANITQTKHY